MSTLLQLADYDRRTRRDAVSTAGNYLTDSVKGLTDLNRLAPVVTAMPAVGEVVGAPLQKFLRESNSAKDRWVSGAAASGTDAASTSLARSGVVSAETEGTISGYLNHAASYLISIVMQFTGWSSERGKLGQAMVTAQGAAEGAKLQSGVAAELEKALNGNANLPPAAAVSKVVADGIADASFSLGAAISDVGSEGKKAVQKLLGQTPGESDSRQTSFAIASNVHASVFQAARGHYLRAQGIVGNEAPPAQAQAALLYAANAAEKISGLTLDQVQAESPAAMDQAKGMAGYLNRQLAAIKEGRTTTAAIEIGSDPVAPAKTPAPERAPASPAVS